MKSLSQILLLTAIVILIEQPTPVVSIDDGFDGSAFGGQKNCPKFKCKKTDEAPVPKWPMRLASTGCSSIGGGGVSMMGGSDERVLLPCCDLYHACNQICGSTKGFCDSSLEKCMDATCDAIQNVDAKKKCEGNVSTKKMMLQFSKCNDFNQGQQKSCKCVKKSDLDEKRKGVVRSFYEKFNPDNVDKADSLAAKASASNKLAGLLIKLVAKYPKAIKSVKDPTQQRMEDMMNGGGYRDEKPKPKKEAKREDVDANDFDADESEIEDSDERIEL